MPDADATFGGGRSDVAGRLDGLADAVRAAGGRIDEQILAPAEMLTERAGQRL